MTTLTDIDKVIKNLHPYVTAVVILKANVGYSAVPVSREEYKEWILLKHHFNGATTLEAIEELVKGTECPATHL